VRILSPIGRPRGQDFSASVRRDARAMDGAMSLSSGNRYRRKNRNRTWRRKFANACKKGRNGAQIIAPRL